MFSVPTKEDAEALVTLVGACQYEEHPNAPGQPWRKIEIGFKRFLEYSDVKDVTTKLSSAWERIKSVR